ncbi:Uncharacterised protein [Vibrio cholerae]|nr:Uncharacterised protein [Vibrio cholerae]
MRNLPVSPMVITIPRRRNRRSEVRTFSNSFSRSRSEPLARLVTSFISFFSSTSVSSSSYSSWLVKMPSCAKRSGLR